ncbi:MAG: zinc-ribbon domain-containing protein [Candidatus Heimdallarchaeota archaeon]
MNCPNCGAELGNANQRYCEFCGTELKNIINESKEEVKVNNSSTRSKRRCC